MSLTITQKKQQGGYCAKIIDIVNNFKLQKVQFNKKEFVDYIKNYLKTILGHLQKTNPDEIEKFMKCATYKAKEWLSKFDDLEFYQGELDPDAMIIVSYQQNEKIIFEFFKDGLK
jgi:hypothetical protein